MSEQYPLADAEEPMLFFRAAEALADAPSLEVEKPSGDLMLRGIPGVTDRIESTTDPSGESGWTVLTTVVLTDSPARLEGLAPPDPNRLYRAVQQ